MRAPIVASDTTCGRSAASLRTRSRSMMVSGLPVPSSERSMSGAAAHSSTMTSRFKSRLATG